MSRKAVMKVFWVASCLLILGLGQVLGGGCATSQEAERDLAAVDGVDICEKRVDGKRVRTGCPGTPRQEALFLRDAGRGKD